MPVVSLDLKRLENWFPGISVNQLIDALPFIALDIESVTDSEIRIEYNPNRPDFGSDHGIARALRGYLGIEIGVPKFNLTRTNNYKILSDSTKNLSRPFITGLVAKNRRLDDPDIRQLSGLQDDLHDGIGRKKIKASIGIYPLSDIKFPLKYTSVSSDFSFTFMNGSSATTVAELLNNRPPGTKYHKLQKKSGGNYSALLDKSNQLISIPPLVNCVSRTNEPGVSNLFIEATSVDRKLAEDIIAILAATVYDIGFTLHSVVVETPEAINYSPNLKSSQMVITTNQVNATLGTKLSTEEIMMSLRRCRLDARAVKKDHRNIICTIPRYRVDIIDKIDIVDEVATGYGINNLIPSIPLSNISGNLNLLSRYLGIIRVTMVGLGFLEVNNFSLINKNIQFDYMGVEWQPDKALTVEGAQNVGLDNLRDSLLPSLMQNLSRNIHEAYPQKIFEIAKVFSNETNREQWHLAVLLAATKSNFTEAKSVLQGLLESSFAKEIKTEPGKRSYFTDGRCARVITDSEWIGELGEISASARDSFKLRVPVAGFEINLSRVLHV